MNKEIIIDFSNNKSMIFKSISCATAIITNYFYNGIVVKGLHCSEQPNGKMNYATASRVRACLLNSNLTFKQANDLFKKKSLPKKYVDDIAAYLEANS